MTYHFNETQAQLESLFLKSLSIFRIYKYVQVQVYECRKTSCTDSSDFNWKCQFASPRGYADKCQHTQT